ncbi:hypothetical protein M0802_000029 [Mischocyttarus mexicanus]|nr:hypothetical protein M0802_000029 [Mischocyttarus mexicanus]
MTSGRFVSKEGRRKEMMMMKEEEEEEEEKKEKEEEEEEKKEMEGGDESEDETRWWCIDEPLWCYGSSRKGDIVSRGRSRDGSSLWSREN